MNLKLYNYWVMLMIKEGGDKFAGYLCSHCRAFPPAILDLLLQSESNVTDLSQALGLSQPLVSKHLRTLRQSGLVKVRIKSQQHIYSLEAEPLAEIDEWLKAYRKKWNQHADALENFLDQQKKD
ncbi:hypothetical protein HMSSN036_53900 [Paenibacillus macerans]|nr:hypothetical protein HMSSN036_53900 [Paenibacillus macerans]